MQDLQKIADALVMSLKNFGIGIKEVYKTKQNNTIYIIFKDENLTQIRISDHSASTECVNNKSSVIRKFNVRLDIEKSMMKILDGYKIFYYTHNQSHELIYEILKYQSKLQRTEHIIHKQNKLCAESKTT